MGQPAARRLIVNADDFGLTVGVNRGIAQAHEHGILTSASLMVRSPHAEAAVSYARARERLSVGLHLDLEPWHYSGTPWIAAHEHLDRSDADAVAAEVAAQLERFIAMTGRIPTHIDSHHHLHREEPAKTIVLEHAARLEVPVRHLSPRVRYEGRFFARSYDGRPEPERITPDALRALLRVLPTGVTEIGCHPGINDDSGSSYSSERALETATLCDPAVRAAIQSEGIDLQAFPAVDTDAP